MLGGRQCLSVLNGRSGSGRGRLDAAHIRSTLGARGLALRLASRERVGEQGVSKGPARLLGGKTERHEFESHAVA